jgi:radical SAM superfamily enzyme YgiQ (UPF0313 family)
MKALLISPKLERSFWSFDETCLRSGRKVLCPPIGLLTVAAMLPADWELRLVDLNARNLADADWDWADVVMVGGMIAQRDSFRDVLMEARRKGKTVVAGGPYPTSLPDEILACGCDFLVRGEAEETLPQLLSALREGRAGGVIEAQARPDVTASPVPRFDLLKIDDYVVMSVQTSRGCPFDCEFCDVVNLYGRRPRFKTPEQVLAELEAVYRLGHRGWVFITDDNFIGNKSHARALLAALTPWNQERGEPFSFWTQATVNLGQDRELIDRMTAANFNTVFIGIESPDEDVLASARKFHNISNPLLESLDNISRNGLSIVGSFIVGLDGEKPGAGERICSFVEQSAIPIVMINLLQVLPNTSLWKRLEQDGRLVSRGITGETIFQRRMNCVPTRPEAQIIEEWRAAWDYLYEPTRFLARNHRFYLAMRPTRAAMAKTRKERLPKKTPASRRPMREPILDLLRFVLLCWRQGIRSPARFRFWKQLFGIRSRNPSRLMSYLGACVIAEDMYRIREEVCRQTGETLREHQETVASAVAGREGAA